MDPDGSPNPNPDPSDGAESSTESWADSPTPTEPTPAKRGPGRPPGSKNKSKSKNKPRGVCQVCGDDADTPSSTYCTEHRPLRADRQPRSQALKPDAVAAQLGTDITTQLELVAMMWAIKDPTCGAALMGSAKEIGEYWGQRAASSPAIARAIENVTGAGGILAGVAIHAPLLMVIVQHHVAPAIQRRQQAAADAQPIYVETPLEYAVADQPAPEGTMPDPVTTPPPVWPPDPAHHVVADGAGYPVGTMADPAAEAAGILTFPASVDDAGAWDVAMARAADASIGETAWGALTPEPSANGDA